MPAPSSSVYRSNSDTNVYENTPNGNHDQAVENNNYGLHRTVSESTGGVANLPPVQLYDEMFTSKPVSEVKTMLWEIKDFEDVYNKKMERAMSFEFEVGRLGSMERHLPRRSRWKITLERDHISDFIGLRVVQLSPENKVIFYELNGCIMERQGGAPPENETEIKVHTDCPCEGSTETKLEGSDNLFPFRDNNTNCRNDYFPSIQRYLSNGSLLVKVTMEIFEDASSSH